MQQLNDTISKVISLKNKILVAMVGLLVAYAVICIFIIFANSSGAFSLISKILFPLGIIGTATILSVDCFYKMAKNENIVRIFGFITLITGILDALLLTLMIWEVIPAYETTMSSFYSSYSVAYKLIMSLLCITGFTFLGSIVLGIKNNHKIIKLSKYITTGFLAISSLISIVSNFVDAYQDMRVYFVQAVSWITAICLGVTVFYLSKTTDWEEKASLDTPSEPKIPPKPIEPAPFRLATSEAPNVEATPAETIGTETIATTPEAAEGATVTEPPVNRPPLLNPTGQTLAEPQSFGHTINPTEKKE